MPAPSLKTIKSCYVEDKKIDLTGYEYDYVSYDEPQKRPDFDDV